MDFEFQSTDFEKIMYPVHMMPDNVDPIKQFPKLKNYPEFNIKQPIVKKNKVFKWIVYMYDKESPFVKKVSDALKRKIEVAKYVRLFENPKEIEPFVQEILLGVNKEINKMAISYCRLQNNSLWSLAVVMESKYYMDLELTMNGKNVKTPITNTQKELEDIMRDLLSKDNSVNVKETLFQYIEEERIMNYKPEGIAAVLAKKEDPFSGEDMDYETH